MFYKLGLILRSFYYLKFGQVYYKLFYRFRNKFRGWVRFQNYYFHYRKGAPLNLTPSIINYKSYKSNTFTFLNRSVHFNDRIEWDYNYNGDLWTYHLNYFNYLHQEGISKEQGMALMYLFCDQVESLTVANHPYPTSIRNYNWIKFISNNNISKKTLDRYLYSQYQILLDNLEYHIMGHHLLENGFSLLFGAYYFKAYELLKEATFIISKELGEQILPDGAHFELSPMHHQIMLYRVLDCYNLMENNTVFEDEQLKATLLSKAELMLGWINKMTYSNGSIPHLNDSTKDIAPTTKEINDYASRLGIIPAEITLKQSGYRRINKGKMEGIIDVGYIGPDYNLFHSHCDTFSFELQYNQNPFIVDSGVSTYETGQQRHKERSTISHNTVRFNRFEQSEIWKKSIVGRRAKTKVLIDEPNKIIASHDGYSRFNIIHQRSFLVEENSLTIQDELISKEANLGLNNSYLHFHPDYLEISIQDHLITIGDWTITLSGEKDVRILDYKYAIAFNKCVPAKMIEISFERAVSMKITHLV